MVQPNPPTHHMRLINMLICIPALTKRPQTDPADMYPAPFTLHMTASLCFLHHSLAAGTVFDVELLFEFLHGCCFAAGDVLVVCAGHAAVAGVAGEAEVNRRGNGLVGPRSWTFDAVDLTTVCGWTGAGVVGSAADIGDQG